MVWRVATNETLELRHLHAQVLRGGAGAGVQLARCPARGLRGLHPQPEARGLDRACRTSTTTAASRAAPWSGRRCSGCSPTSQAGKIDIVVVYKVDRLTRSLGDFAKIVEVFDAPRRLVRLGHPAVQHHTSMGRLTLNVLLSFAQFEREVTGERIRDKIAASKKKGMWMGGLPPLGYDVQDRKLVVNEPRLRRSATSSAAMPSSNRSAPCRQELARAWRSSARLGRDRYGSRLWRAEAARARRALPDAAEPRSIAARSSTRARAIPASTRRSSMRNSGKSSRRICLGIGRRVLGTNR